MQRPGYMRVVFLWLCLSVAALAQAWQLPSFDSVPVNGPVPGRWLYRQSVPGRGTLLVNEEFVQLNVGKKPLWRVRLRDRVEPPLRGTSLRFEAANQEVVVLRSFIRSADRTALGDVAYALRLKDGSLAWVADPLTATPDRVGAPNVRQGAVVYETYVSPSWRAVIVARRLRDGSPVFMRDVPQETAEASDLIGRTVERLQPRPDGLMVYVTDRQRRWQTYLFGLHDGVLKQSRTGQARAGDRLWE